jgi:hypothetical protein
MKLKNYIIEARNPVLGYWEIVHTIEPLWKITERCDVHHLLWWSWLKTETLFQDSGISREKCRERAMLWAFEFYRGPNEDVRVRKTHDWDGQQVHTTVWENGEWKDC